MFQTNVFSFSYIQTEDRLQSDSQCDVTRTSDNDVMNQMIVQKVTNVLGDMKKLPENYVSYEIYF